MLIVMLVCGVAGADTPAEQAAGWIGKLGDPTKVEQARDRLRQFGKIALPALLEGLQHPDESVRAESAFVLGRIGSTKAVESLIEALKDKSVRVREKTTYALGELADARAVKALIKLLTDPEAVVRANAAFALGQIGQAGSKAATPALIRALCDRDVLVRNQAANALGSAGDKRAPGPLVWVIENETVSEVRALATSSLANLRDARAVGVLVGLLSDKDMLVRARAIDGLFQLTGNRFGYNPRLSKRARAPKVIQWKTWYARNREKLGVIEPVNPHKFDLPKPPKPKPPKPEPEPPKPKPPKPEPPEPEPPKPAIVLTHVIVGRILARAPVGDIPEIVAENFNRGVELYDAGEFAEALKQFQVAVEKLPNEASVLYNLALTRQQLGQLQVSSEIYQKLLATDAGFRPALNNLGIIHEVFQQPKAAENCYRRALRTDPESPHLIACYNLSNLLFAQQKFEEALGGYDLLWNRRKNLPIKLSPATIHFRRMQCTLKLGRTVELHKLFALEGPPPDEENLLRAYGWCRYDGADYAGAERALLRALHLGRIDAESTEALAQFYLRVPNQKMRNPARALVYAEQSVKRTPREIRYWRTLFSTSMVCGKKTRALDALRKIVELDHDDAAAAERLKRFENELSKPEP